MEIMHGIIVVVVAGAAVCAFGLALFVGYFVAVAFWPALIGLIGGYFIWEGFDQDLAIGFAILGLIGQLFLSKHKKKHHVSPLEVANMQREEKSVRDIYFPRHHNY